ncbi:MAG: TonB family protein [Alistipes sp.]|nr:TonB family protein [Alistipes sp.]
MFDFIIYLGQSALCLAALYLIYKVAMSHETLHYFNRVLLLGSVLLSALLPLCRVKIVKEYDPAPTLASIEIDDMVVADVADVALGIDYVSLLKDLAVMVFFVGVAFMLVRLAVGIYSVWRLIHSGQMSVIEEDVTLTVVDNLSSPFSWFGHIVASQSDVQQFRGMILAHELAHIRLRHSWDVMFVDVALCLWWFNPAMWLLRRELQALHEYQADDAVLNGGVDAKSYQMLLIKRAVGSRLHSVANCLNHSNLNNRITMMCKKNSSRWAATKALLVVPMVAVAMGAFATTVYVPREVQDKVTENSVNNKEYKPAIIEIKGSEIYLNDKQVTAAELEAVIEEYRLQTLIYDENDAASKRTYEAIHNTLKLNGNIDAIYSNGKRPEVSVVRISGDKIYLNDEQITLEQLKVKADAMDKTVTIVMHSDVNTDAEQLNAVKESFRHTSHAVKVISEKERIAIVDGKVVPYEEMMKIESSNIGNARLTYDYNTLPQGLGISEDDVKKNGAIVITLKKDGDTKSKPVVVIDGKVVAYEEMSKIDPNTIGDMSVLKDKSAKEVVAELGLNVSEEDVKNGVVVIRLKKDGDTAVLDNATENKVIVIADKQDDKPYIKVEKMPTFNGGGNLVVFQNWIQNNIRYPKQAMEKGIGGRVIFQFVVERDGTPTSFNVLQSPDKSLSDEVERIFKTSPKWEAGEQNGEKVRVLYTVPVVFTTPSAETQEFEQQKQNFEAQKQNFEQQKDLAYIKVEKMPTFQGGDLNTFRNWVQSQIQYPKEAMEKNISGRVIFSFVVEKDGSTSDFTVLQTPDKLLADEVDRIFKTCPKWEPGTQRGEKVRVKYTVPIVFALVSNASENVSGVVVDTEGKPLIGVIVQVDGSDARGVVTDVEGRFSIPVSNGETLKFSYIGMDTKQVKVNNIDKPLSVTMK